MLSQSLITLFCFQMKPARRTLLLNICILASVRVSGNCVHHQQNLLYLCDTGIFHSVWVNLWSAGWNETRQPPIHSEKYQCRIDTVSSADDGHIVVQNI